MKRLFPMCCVLVLIGCWSAVALSAEPNRSPEQWMQWWTDQWDESQWGEEFAGRPGHMRPLTDTGWEARMLALQSLVSHGPDSVSSLLDALKSGEAPQRILAAQALSFLAPHTPLEPLLHAAKNDPDPAVRLYAVDALGMRGQAEDLVDWSVLRQDEKNRDVLKHISYAMERKNAGIDPAVVRSLTEWNAATINSAATGKLAPDFELASATGETIRLSQFRGKRLVVLVFVYGDT